MYWYALTQDHIANCNDYSLQRTMRYCTKLCWHVINSDICNLRKCNTELQIVLMKLYMLNQDLFEMTQCLLM